MPVFFYILCSGSSLIQILKINILWSSELDPIQYFVIRFHIRFSKSKIFPNPPTQYIDFWAAKIRGPTPTNDREGGGKERRKRPCLYNSM